MLTDLDTNLVPAVGVTAANVAEAKVADQIKADLEAQQRTLAELDIDRAYLSSSLVRDRDPSWSSSARRSRSATAPGSPRPRSPSTSTKAC